MNDPDRRRRTGRALVDMRSQDELRELEASTRRAARLVLGAGLAAALLILTAVIRHESTWIATPTLVHLQSTPTGPD
jgi:hypothetical protein